MMFGLFGKKKERRHPVILDLSVKEKPDGWDELTRLSQCSLTIGHGRTAFRATTCRPAGD